jgi:hypothetical protein
MVTGSKRLGGPFARLASPASVANAADVRILTL